MLRIWESGNVATLQEETLTDGSRAWNVIVSGVDERTAEPVNVRLCCVDQRHAVRLYFDIEQTV